MKAYEKFNITLDNLQEKLYENAEMAYAIRDFISETNKNLFNEQFVINWQDYLNDVSITRKCDLI